MAIRTTSSAVSGVIEVDVNIPLDPFIEVASSIVDKIVEPNLDDDVQEELVERWLAAHYYAIRDPRTTKEAAGKGAIAVSYESKVDLGLNETRYGTTAMTIDTSGSLANWNDDVVNGKAKRPGTVTWLGTEY